MRYTKDHQQAEEVANDTFLKVYHNIKRYDASRSFKTWLSRITANTCIDQLRKNKKTLVFAELNHEITSGVATNELTLNNNQKILPIIQSLPPQYKIVFNLYVFEEYNHKEIGEMLGISVNTSKSNYHRAKKIIIKKLHEMPEYSYLLNPAI
ncbi:MAG: sigma-70 family RNA polymerase sigma factor, partial [Saprospiraceae bacterium]|nr:sigma-70 family RNA polymerase sigma factor [Saprospiraceae bacterium]